MEQKKTTGHSLTLCDREKLTLTGVTDVDAFNEEEITVITDFGELTVRGELLHVEALDLECGSMQITGKVTALLYTQHREGGGLFGRSVPWLRRYGPFSYWDWRFSSSMMCCGFGVACGGAGARHF